MSKLLHINPRLRYECLVEWHYILLDRSTMICLHSKSKVQHILQGSSKCTQSYASRIRKQVMDLCRILTFRAFGIYKVSHI